jgi:endonuclease/exonuclease/phosphatase family metal-dependent hydrolase
MPRVKVMTVNLRGYRGEWSARRDRLISAMQSEEVDVVLLQEVSERGWRPNQAGEIAYLTGYAMAYIPAQRYFPLPSISTGLGVLSRFPISNQLETVITPGSSLFSADTHERRVAQRVELSLDGMSVLIYNTHFPTHAEARLDAAQRLWRQVMQEEAVLVVVGGNFNAPPDEPSIIFLQGRTVLDTLRTELTDSWTVAGIGPAATFPATAPTQRVDYIFYQAEPTVIVQEAKTLGAPPTAFSDHLAVVATFTISPSREPTSPFEEEPTGALEPTGGRRFGG